MAEATDLGMIAVLMEILRQLGINLPESRLKMMAGSVDPSSCVQSFLAERRNKLDEEKKFSVIERCGSNIVPRMGKGAGYILRCQKPEKHRCSHEFEIVSKEGRDTYIWNNEAEELPPNKGTYPETDDAYIWNDEVKELSPDKGAYLESVEETTGGKVK